MTTSTSHVSAIDSTVHKTHVWLEELAQDAGLIDQGEAYSVLRAVLHALRDELTAQEVADLSSQLPMLIRGLYYEGWKGASASKHPRTRQGFIDRVALELGGMPHIRPQAAVEAVFRLLDHRISQGEIEDIRSILPRAIRDFWPQR